MKTNPYKQRIFINRYIPFNGVTPPCPGFVWYNKVKGYSQNILCSVDVNGAVTIIKWA